MLKQLMIVRDQQIWVILVSKTKRETKMNLNYAFALLNL